VAWAWAELLVSVSVVAMVVAPTLLLVLLVVLDSSTWSAAAAATLAPPKQRMATATQTRATTTTARVVKEFSALLCIWDAIFNVLIVKNIFLNNYTTVGPLFQIFMRHILGRTIIKWKKNFVFPVALAIKAGTTFALLLCSHLVAMKLRILF
jgi:hypothetical protein